MGRLLSGEIPDPSINFVRAIGRRKNGHGDLVVMSALWARRRLPLKQQAILLRKRRCSAHLFIWRRSLRFLHSFPATGSRTVEQTREVIHVRPYSSAFGRLFDAIHSEELFDMDRAELINAILTRMEQVWGDGGLSGEPEQYAWLLEHFGISEEEDVQWQLVLEYDMDELSEEDREDPEVMQFVEDEEQVVRFLENLLRKYESVQLQFAP
ncbi:hypothetical protein [Ralstonia condita]|nr:hypothetical protein [Ralstonia sp. LMG 7141]